VSEFLKKLVDLSLHFQEWNEMATTYSTGVLINDTLSLCLTDQVWLMKKLEQLDMYNLKILRPSLTKLMMHKVLTEEKLYNKVKELYAISG